MEWVFRWILLLYPAAFRSEFDDEIAAVFRQSAAEKRAQGRLALAAWLGIGLFLAFVAHTQGWHGPGARFWRDLSLLSFSLYGGLGATCGRSRRPCAPWRSWPG